VLFDQLREVVEARGYGEGEEEEAEEKAGVALEGLVVTRHIGITYEKR
jgi:hypothetical protein